MPTTKNCKSVYKNSSGFVLKDSRIPFIFLPGDLNPEEITYRQIYSLLYLLIIIGLEIYDYSVERPAVEGLRVSPSPHSQEGYSQEGYIHDVVAELLCPSKFYDDLKLKIGDNIDVDIINDIRSNYKISFSAFITILSKRNLITSEQYETLKKSYKHSSSSQPGFGRMPKITNAVNKFLGRQATDIINKAVNGEKVNGEQATKSQLQLLLFGRVDNKKYSKYKELLGIHHD